MAIFTRKELYKAVWSKPITELAKEIGVSDVAIAKRCKRCNIPVPGRGYWRKIETGSKLPRTPLPKWKGPDEIVFYPQFERRPSQSAAIDTELPDYVQFEHAPENRVVVSDTLSRPHPLIRAAKRSLKMSNSDRKGEEFIFKSEPCLDIRVSRATRDRALCIMDSLIKALESRGMMVEVGGTASTTVSDGENKLGLSLHEAFRYEATGEKWPDGKSVRKSVLTGKLTLRVESDRYHGYHGLWRDRKLKPMQVQLNSVLIGIHEGLATEEVHRLQEEEEKRKRMEEARKHQELSQLLKQEQSKVARLDGSMEKWHKAQQIRAYVIALKENVVQRSGTFEPGSELAEWITWVLSYADQIDPMVPTPPSLEEQLKKLRPYYW